MAAGARRQVTVEDGAGEGYSTEEEIFQPTKPKTAMALPAHGAGATQLRKSSSQSSRGGLLDNLLIEVNKNVSQAHLMIGNEGDVGQVR